MQSVAIFTGVGKTHIAQALGHLAIRNGAETRFLKTSRVLAHLAGGHADHTWDKRLRELTRPAVLTLDDFGMRELTPGQAESLLDRLINTSHQVYMNGPSYRPNKRPGRAIPTRKEDIR